MNEGDQQSFSDLDKALAENNRRLAHIQSLLRLISLWLALILVVLTIEYGDDLRATVRGWVATTGKLLKG